jgi:hypothetical protein
MSEPFHGPAGAEDRERRLIESRSSFDDLNGA